MQVRFAAMDLKLRAQVESVLRCADKEPMAQMQEVQSLLLAAGLAYKAQEKPTMLLVHPCNRGGLMVNPHDCHSRGCTMVQTGIRPELLQTGSVAFELATDPVAREAQYAANEKMARAAGGMLAPVTRTERLLSVAGSHTSQFFKAMLAGARAADGSSLGAFIAERGPDHLLRKVAEGGWQWFVVQSCVEESFPELPHLLQQAYNAAHAAVTPLSEMEVASSYAAYFAELQGRGSDAEECRRLALERVVAGRPPCGKYVESICHWVLRYGGGADESFPMVQFLQEFAKTYGGTLLLGEDFVRAVAHTEIKEESMPFVRAACLAAQLTSPKVKDGFARLLSPGDVERLKTPGAQVRAREAEAAFRLGWPLYQQARGMDKEGCVPAFGRFLVRGILWLLQKEKHGREKVEFPDMAAISSAYAREVQGAPTPAGAQASRRAPSSGRAALAMSLKDCENPAVHALHVNEHVQVGKRYTCKDHPGRVFVLESLDGSGAKFVATTLFEGQVEVVEVHACKHRGIYTHAE